MKYPAGRIFRRCYNTPGDAHFATWTCYDHRRYFDDPRACRTVIEQLAYARHIMAFRLWAYVVMPTHAHILIHPMEPEYNMSDIMQRIKGRASKFYHELLEASEPAACEAFMVRKGRRRSFRLWQKGGGYDHNVRRARAVRNIIAYIENNPVRAGLVARAEQWPWSSAYARARGEGVVPDEVGEF